MSKMITLHKLLETLPTKLYSRSGASDSSARRLDDSQSTLNGSFSDELPGRSPPQTSELNSEVSVTPDHPVENLVAANPSDPAMGLDATLGSLKISTPLKADTRSHNNIPISPRLLFSEKIGCSPKLNSSYCMHKNPVSPPRLSAKNITQSSWVAGGYWGHPVSPARDVSSHHVVPLFSQISPNASYPLSRSSSQSSGFISQSSGPTAYRIQGPCSLPNSRHGSLCGDFDHGSVLSEPAYKPWGMIPSLYPSDSASQCGHSKYPAQSKSDAQSLHSCSSAYSDCSLRYTPPSPISSSSTVYQSTQSNVREHCSSDGQPQNRVFGEGRGGMKGLKSTKYDQNFALTCRNPWFAFFLGMSFAANGFLVAILYMQADVHFFWSS